MLAGNFRLLQDETCLIGAKNYRRLPSLGATISLVCTCTAQQNKALLGENGLPELLQQSCHTAIELSSGGDPCWNRRHALGTTLVSLALPHLMLLKSSCPPAVSQAGSAQSRSGGRTCPPHRWSGTLPSSHRGELGCNNSRSGVLRPSLSLALPLHLPFLPPADRNLCHF